MSNSEQLFAEAREVMPGGVNSPVRAFGSVGGIPPFMVGAKGAYLTDADGKEYLDLLGGIAVNALGHAHPAVVEAVSRQVATLGHVSNFYTHPNVLDLAERLRDLSGFADARVLFCNSGAEANEAAFKIARLTGRPRILACHNAFHGRTMGALALTGQPAKQAPFAPMTPGVGLSSFMGCRWRC